MLTIGDIESPNSIIGWWNSKANERQPYIYQSLLTATHEDTENINLIFGENEEVRGLSLTTDDTDAIKLNNIGFSSEGYRMASFKNYKMMNEKRRNQIKQAVANNPDQAEIEALTRTQYQDPASLLDFALYTREKLFVQALTTGKIALASNDLTYGVDFHMPAEHVQTVGTPWGTMDSSPLDDMDQAAQGVLNDNGTVIAYALMNGNTFRKIVRSGEVVNSLSLGKTSNNVALPQADVKDLMTNTTNITPLIYNKADKNGRFIPDDTVVLIPNGSLGRLAWTDTNEALGLIGESSAQVSTTADGITLTTYRNVEPVGTMVKATQKFVPAFDKVRNVVVMNVGQTKAGAPTNVKATPTNDGATVTADAPKN